MGVLAIFDFLIRRIRRCRIGGKAQEMGSHSSKIIIVVSMVEKVQSSAKRPVI